MFNKEDLIKDFEKMGLLPTDTVLVHSSYKNIAGEEGIDGGAETVIDAFIDYFGEEGLVVFPALTWKVGFWVNDKGDFTAPYSENKEGFYPFGNTFDVRNTPCHGLGIIPELFRVRKGVVRSLSPTHSLCAYGKEAKEFCSGHEKSSSACAWDSPWGKLYDRKAKILFLGIPMANNTFMHVLEWKAQLPDLAHPHVWDFTVVDYDGKEISVSYQRPYAGHNRYYHYVQDELIEAGVVRVGKLGAGQTLIADAVLETDYMMEKFKKTPKLFYPEYNEE